VYIEPGFYTMKGWLSGDQDVKFIFKEPGWLFVGEKVPAVGFILLPADG
jgi:hypothetical protein